MVLTCIDSGVCDAEVTGVGPDPASLGFDPVLGMFSCALTCNAGLMFMIGLPFDEFDALSADCAEVS